MGRPTAVRGGGAHRPGHGCSGPGFASRRSVSRLLDTALSSDAGGRLKKLFAPLCSCGARCDTGQVECPLCLAQTPRALRAPPMPTPPRDLFKSAKLPRLSHVLLHLLSFFCAVRFSALFSPLVQKRFTRRFCFSTNPPKHQ
jgi:hypothetical protein